MPIMDNKRAIIQQLGLLNNNLSNIQKDDGTLSDICVFKLILGKLYLNGN
jgi:hypothetical protein